MKLFIKKLYNKWFKDSFTVACDLSPFWSPINEREILFHVKGLWKARIIAKKWVLNHTFGQARILIGNIEWKENTGEIIQ